MVEYAAAAGIARITLNRPDKRNAITREMMSALRDALQQAAEDPAVRVLLIRGAGKDFCAGLDLKHAMKRRAGQQVGGNGVAKVRFEIRAKRVVERSVSRRRFRLPSSACGS